MTLDTKNPMSSKNLRISGRQIAAARELLNITQRQLADAAEIQPAVLARFEAGTVEPREATREKVRVTLEALGIEFTNGQGPGVRIRAVATTESTESVAD